MQALERYLSLSIFRWQKMSMSSPSGILRYNQFKQMHWFSEGMLPTDSKRK